MRVDEYYCGCAGGGGGGRECTDKIPCIRAHMHNVLFPFFLEFVNHNYATLMKKRNNSHNQAELA